MLRYAFFDCCYAGADFADADASSDATPTFLRHDMRRRYAML